MNVTSGTRHCSKIVGHLAAIIRFAQSVLFYHVANPDKSRTQPSQSCAPVWAAPGPFQQIPYHEDKASHTEHYPADRHQHASNRSIRTRSVAPDVNCGWFERWLRRITPGTTPRTLKPRSSVTPRFEMCLHPIALPIPRTLPPTWWDPWQPRDILRGILSWMVARLLSLSCR